MSAVRRTLQRLLSLSLLLTTNAAKDRRSHRKEKERENSDVREGDYEILKMVSGRGRPRVAQMLSKAARKQR